MIRLPLWTSLLVAVLVTSSQAQDEYYENLSGRYECPRGDQWSLLEVRSVFGEFSEVVCYTVADARAFSEAAEQCHLQQAGLLAPLKPFSSYSTSTGTGFLELLARNGVTNFWFGIYVRDGRLRKDTFPMTQMRSSSFRQDVFVNVPWAVNETSPAHSEPQGTSNCFEMAVNLNISCTPDEGVPALAARESNPNFLEFGTAGSLPQDALPTTELPSDQTSGSDQTGSRRKRSFHAPDSGRLQTLIASGHRRARLKQRQGLGVLGLSRTSSKVKVRSRRQTEVSCEDRRVSVRSKNCRESLPFVCVKPALEKSSIVLGALQTLCQPGEFGHKSLPWCFSYGQERLNFSTAQARCETEGPEVDVQRPRRTLFRTFSEGSSSYLRGLVVKAITSALNLKQSSDWRNSFAWVGRKEEERGECLALSLDTSDVISWDCSARLPFYVCQSPVSLPASWDLTVKVIPPNRSQMPIIRSIAGSDDRQVSVPYQLSLPNADTSLALSCEFDLRLVADLQTVALVKNGIPLRNVYEFFGELQDNSRNMTDYYWCEVNDLKSGEVRRSGRVFVRTSGVEMYAVSIVLETLAQSTRPQVILNSLYGEIPGPLVTKLPFSNFDYRVLRYRPELSPRSSARTVVDLHFFNKTLAQGETAVTSQSLLAAQRLIRAWFLALNRTDGPVSLLDYDIRTLRVRSIDICPSTTVADPVSGKIYVIPDTDLGAVFTSPDVCLSNGEPYVRLRCEGDKLYGAVWSEFKATPGCRFKKLDTSAITPSLKNISESDINEASLNEVLKNTTVTVSVVDTFAVLDLVYLADILQQATDLDTVSVQNVQEILDLVDVVAGINRTVLEKSNELGNATNRILRAVDEVGSKVQLDDDVSVRVVADTAALEVWDLGRVTDDVIVGLELQLSEGEPVEVMDKKDVVSVFDTYEPSYTQTDAAILLTGSFVRQIQDDHPGKDVRLSLNVFADTALFRLGRLELGPNQFSKAAVLNSKVIAAKVTVEGVGVTDLNDNVVTTVYLPVVSLPPDSRADNSTCVFWDFAGARGQGAWSAEGCRYNRTQLGRDVCVCDHLTNFAVLLDVYGQSELPPDHQLALSIITIVGLSLSIVGLSCTILSFLLIRKLRQGRPQQTLFNMALALLAAWVVFLAGFSRVGHYAGCLAVAALLHYFILAAFMWMLMEGLLQYLLFVRVLGNNFHNYLLKTALPAWGLPLIPVIAILAIDVDLYRGGDQYCWMSRTPFYYAFLAPVALIVLVNIVVYIMAVVTICRRGRIGSSSSGSSRAVGIRASVACFVALGLSWVFAFFAVEDARVVFQYLFTITSTLQGFLLFLIFTARDPAVRGFWKDACCSWRARGTLKSSSTDPLGDRATGKSQGAHQISSDNVPLNDGSENSGVSSGNGSSGGGTSSSQLSPHGSSGGPGMGFVNESYE